MRRLLRVLNLEVAQTLRLSLVCDVVNTGIANPRIPKRARSAPNQIIGFIRFMPLLSAVHGSAVPACDGPGGPSGLRNIREPNAAHFFYLPLFTASFTLSTARSIVRLILPTF